MPPGQELRDEKNKLCTCQGNDKIKCKECFEGFTGDDCEGEYQFLQWSTLENYVFNLK